MKNYYSNYYASWEWTEPIVERYLENFTKFDATQANFKGQVYVGVYGPTQVGKTTFILNLIGINENKLNELSQALRGKQSKGKSSTVTATLYEKNPNDNFEIIFPTKEKQTCETCEELSVILKKFRTKVTTQNYEAMDEMIIRIPKSYFYSKNHENNLIIVDLPGDDTKDESEEKHVENILNKYLVLCKTIVIMEIGTKINNLYQLPLDSMKGWVKDSSRFMIVLTREASNRDVQEKLLSGKLESLEQMKNYYFNDLERAAIENQGVEEFNIPFFFFELGGSLEVIKNTNKDMYDKLRNFNKKNFTELIEQLHKNNLPEFKIKGLKSISSDIEKLKRKNLEELNNKKLTTERKIVDINNRVKELDKLFDSHTQTITNEKEKWKELKNNLFLENALKIIENKYEDYKFDKYKMKYEDINGPYQMMMFEIIPYLENLKRTLKFSLNLNNNFYQGIINKIDVIINSGPLSVDFTLLRKVHTYEYYYAVNDIYDRITKIKEELESYISLAYKKFIEKYENKLKAFSSSYEKEILSKESSILAALNKDIELAQIEWDKEVEKVDLLENIFIEEYINQMSILKQRLYDKNENKNNKPYIIIEMNIITNQTERVLNING
ncbi:MAG: hypothetical protein NRZ54_01730 [Staphylococcus haemolyticus]|nr:hypothetical protein NRZ53_12050 [Staphylococcus haemolyticus]WAI19731.1 MAG: hypothetical protein NRZ55_08970 [Staphylococcus haemolyticus]WAI23276.1 MAG: hypothetical protein NRZ54_01730 [Staphylococcus haemolyticus]